MSNPEHYGLTGAFVCCRSCCARGPLQSISDRFVIANGVFRNGAINDETIERGRENAVIAWDTRLFAV